MCFQVLLWRFYRSSRSSTVTKSSTVIGVWDYQLSWLAFSFLSKYFPYFFSFRALKRIKIGKNAQIAQRIVALRDFLTQPWHIFCFLRAKSCGPQKFLLAQPWSRASNPTHIPPGAAAQWFRMLKNRTKREKMKSSLV